MPPQRRVSTAVCNRLSGLLVEQAPQVVGGEVGIAEDAGEGAATEFPVQRDDEGVPVSVFFKRTWLPR
jgi:hypothetical protein